MSDRPTPETDAEKINKRDTYLLPETSEWIGSAEGVRARQFPEFMYRIASCVSVIPICERVDFVVEVDEDDVGKSVVQVFLLPSKFTIAKQRKLIFKLQANTWQMPEIRQFANWAADQAFRTHDARTEEAK